MKPFASLLLAAAVMIVSACSSGVPSSRSDYTNPSFGSASSRRAAREAEIRKLHPDMTDKQVSQKLLEEFPGAGSQK